MRGQVREWSSVMNYEIIVVTEEGEQVRDGSIHWNPDTGDWWFTTCNRKLDAELRAIRARGVAWGMMSIETDEMLADAMVPVRPTDAAFLETLHDWLASCGCGVLELRSRERIDASRSQRYLDYRGKCRKGNIEATRALRSLLIDPSFRAPTNFRCGDSSTNFPKS